ncbi:unnamed protein product, partial [marine sediment metagenome]
VAGVEYLFTIPSGVLFEIICLSFTFTTDANVADRFIALQIEDPGGDIYFKSLLPAPLVASGTNQISFGAGYAHPSQGDAHKPTTGSWPVHLLIPGPHIISITVANIQAADAITDIRGWFHERIITRV